MAGAAGPSDIHDPCMAGIGPCAGGPLELLYINGDAGICEDISDIIPGVKQGRKSDRPSFNESRRVGIWDLQK